MAATPQLIKELRELTGAGMMDCKNALNETGGDLEKAVQALREAGLGKAAKKHMQEAYTWEKIAREYEELFLR